MITFDIDDTKAIARLDHMPEQVRLALQRKRNVLMLQLEAKAKSNAPVGPNTDKHTGGQLRRSIFSRPEDTANSVQGIVATGADTPYAKIQELGGKTPAHDIIPTKAKALAFVVGGKQVFAKIVHHPGSNIKGQFYMRRALESMKGEIEAGLTEAVREGAR